ncbi:ABC transporter permease [Paenibacillus harenae]|uniref:ABC-2 type transport system permease protein n=1 Tax=Paenibacillus harenae TaxID=306543 RepID=A0ABT9TZX1_PAEHA|nr:ABC transporter permease [Paenibacillus harenae]MDQ0112935.1 ABC-2 type transport system permease protein [Paenibacillus harenae]
MPSIAIAIQLIKRTVGSRRGLFLNMLLPAILLSVLTGLLSAQGQQAVIVVANADAGELGSYLTAALAREELYDVREASGASDEYVKQQVLDGKADAAVYIPSDYTVSLLEGKHVPVALYRMNVQLWNASLATTLEAETMKLSASAGMVARAEGVDKEQMLPLLQKLLAAQEKPVVTTKHVGMKLGNILSNPIMIGILLMFVMMLVSQSIGFVMEDRELRTMARMYTAPVRAIDISLGNFLGSMAVGTLQLVIVLSLTYFVFQYDPGVSYGYMLLVLEFFLLAAVGLTTAIAGLVRDSRQLTQMNNLVIMPSCMVSGCFFPLSMLPTFMQKLANFLPQKWALQAIDRLGGGGSVADIGLQLAILLLFAAVLIAFGSAVLRPSKLSR